MAHTPDQQRVLDDIRKYGCHVIHVQRAGGESPYTYTIGIGRTSDAPDVVLFGQPHATAHRLLHAYNQRIRRDERFDVGQVADGFLKGQQVAFRPVAAAHLMPLFAWNAWLHDGPGFRMLQMVYPTLEGIWPWDDMADEWIRRLQPLLDQPTLP